MEKKQEEEEYECQAGDPPPIIMKSRFQCICVFCGSSPGKNPSYQLAAIQLGNQLVCSPFSFYSIFSKQLIKSSALHFLLFFSRSK